MGRGRQKAKHTKVARELKYFSPNTDLSQLQRELASQKSGDPWAEYAEKYNDDDDEYSDDEPDEHSGDSRSDDNASEDDPSSDDED